MVDKRMKRSKKTAKGKAPEQTSLPKQLLEVPTETSGLRSTIATFGDATQPIEVRREAMQAVQAASFGAPNFDSVRSDYIAALRKVAEDQDVEIRQRALGILAREHDGFAQNILLHGLQNPEAALLPPEKALQLLSYDPHSGAYPVAREMVKTSSSESVKREALRLLAGDPQSAPLIEQMLADKDETPEVRRMSAAALNALNPEKLQSLAKNGVLDKSEDNEVIATYLTALNQFGDAQTIVENNELRKRVDQLKNKGSAKVKRAAKQFAKKYGPEGIS